MFEGTTHSSHEEDNLAFRAKTINSAVTRFLASRNKDAVYKDRPRRHPAKERSRFE